MHLNNEKFVWFNCENLWISKRLLEVKSVVGNNALVNNEGMCTGQDEPGLAGPLNTFLRHNHLRLCYTTCNTT